MKPLRRAMATQVELGSALTSLAGISEPRTEAAFRHSFINSLSDASRKPGEGPCALAPLIPEGRGNPVGLATMPSTTSRPPWTPKPFSRETSSDTFATVKPPVPALKPSSATPKPPTFDQKFEDAAKGSPGNVPPLLDQKPSMDSKSPMEPVAHLPFYLNPQANTVILFESRRPAKGRAEEGGSKAQEGQLLRSQSEKWPRRQPSLSTDLRPVSWAPHWKEAFAGGPKPSASSVETEQSPTPATETHSQAGGRPAASAGFGGSWQEQTQPAPPEAASGPGTPKPRPLSTDLTGRFETREPSWQRKPCLAESREKGDGALEATGASSAAASLSGAAPSGPRAKSASQLAESPQSCLPSAPPSQTVPEDPGQNSAEEETVPWELGSQGKRSVGQHSASQGQPLAGRGEVTPQAAGLRNTDPPDASDGNHRGCAKKTVPLLDVSAKPTESQSLRGSPGKETRMLNIQQRIQVLTAETAGFKAGGLGRSFRSRPLSTDLTKMFSGPVTAGELKPKRQPEWSRKPAGEMQEAPEEETLPVSGADVGEAGVASSPWKPPLLAKTPSRESPPKRHGSFGKGRLNASLPGEDLGFVLSPKARTLSSSSAEDGCPKTVRATMFEHHVERHSVVASQLGAEPALLSLMVPFGGSPPLGQEFQKERMLGDGQSTKASAREADASGEAGGPKDPRPLTPTWAEDPQGEKGDQPASKGMEDSLLAQRIEPRYEILQMVGERAQSEAVAAASGGKAVTLRRQRYFKENRRAGGYGKSEGCRGASAPGTGPLKDHPAVEGIQAAFYSEGTGPERNRARQQAATFRRKDDGKFAPWLETEKESRLPPAGVTEGCTLQRAGARLPEADGWEGRAGLLDQQTSRVQSASCPGLLFSLDLKPSQGLEDPEGQKLRSVGYGAAQEKEKREATVEGKESRELATEARWTSSFHEVSAHRGSDRWRRKTLPHGSPRFEEPGEPPQGPAELASRRGALHLMDGSAAKRSPQTLHGREASRQAEVTSPSSAQKPRSPPEPKATYFAVTCQISEEINSQPGRAAAMAPLVSPSRTADPFSEGGSSPARPLSRHRGETGAVDRLEPGASQAPPSKAGDQELLQRRPEASAEGRPARADSRLCPGARSPPYLAALQQDSQQKRSGALGLGREEEEEEEEESPHRYRSRVVDIDELMAEYGAQESRKLCAGEGQRESSFFPWEKWPPRSSFSGNLPCSPDQREKARLEQELGSKGLGTEASRAHGSDPLEAHPQGSRAREGKGCPPQWGKPDTEKPKPGSAEPPGPRTRTSFFLGREQGEGTRQSAKDATPGPHPARMDPGGLWKEASPKQWAVLAPAGGGCPSSDWGGSKTGWKAEPQAGVWEKGPPAAQPGAERSSAAASPETPGAMPELKRSSSDKTHRSPARLSFPLGPRLDQTHIWQRVTPERPGPWLSKGGPLPGDCSSHGATRDLGGGGLRVDHDDATALKRSPYLLSQRRSHSFYKERRTDHWPGDHLKQCFGRPPAEARDTDVLVQEADGSYGTWGDQQQSGDSFTPESPSSEGSVAPTQKPSPGRRASLHSAQRAPATAADRQDSSREQRSHSLDDPSPEADSASPPTEKASPDFSFLEQTPRLDSRVLKSRILLDKRRQQLRAPISHTLRRGAQPAPNSVGQGAASAWTSRDSTDGAHEEKPPRAGEEEESPPAERLFPAQPRLPLFPGLASSALKAQLRKRHESEERREEAPPAPLCKSAKGPFPARGSGGRALVATPEKEGSRGSSSGAAAFRAEELGPPWLMELKSRRKQGQPESPI